MRTSTLNLAWRGCTLLLPSAGFAIVTAVLFRWVAPAWWTTGASILLVAWAQRFRVPSFPESLVVWIGQGVALASVRHWRGMPDTLIFTLPMLVIPLMWRYVPLILTRLENWSDRFRVHPVGRWLIATPAIVLPVIAAAVAGTSAWGPQVVALAAAIGVGLAHRGRSYIERWMIPLIGAIGGLCTLLTGMRVGPAITAMPFETLAFLSPVLLGFGTLIVAGTWHVLRQPKPPVIHYS